MTPDNVGSSSCAARANTEPRQQIGRQVLRDGLYNLGAIANLIMQFVIVLGEDLEGDAISHLHLPISGQALPPGCEDMDHPYGDAPGPGGGLAAKPEHATAFDDRVLAARSLRAALRIGGMSRVFGVEIIVLAAPLAVVPARRREAEHRGSSALLDTEPTSAMYVRTLNPDTAHVAAGPYPGQYPVVPLAGGRKVLDAKQAVERLDRSTE